jgi:hypothetical protein
MGLVLLPRVGLEQIVEGAGFRRQALHHVGAAVSGKASGVVMWWNLQDDGSNCL